MHTSPLPSITRAELLEPHAAVSTPRSFPTPQSPPLLTNLLSHSFAPILLFILLGTASILPAILQGIPSGPDLPSHLRYALALHDSVLSGTLAPGWLSQSNDGFGDTCARVYPPGIYYLLAAARSLTGDWYAGFLLAFTIISILGCAGTYFWAHALMPRRYAIWAAVFYAFAPFHINEFYQAALLPEFAGGMLLAFAFGFAERVCSRSSRKDTLGLAAAFALLIYTHPPMMMMGSLALMLYVLLRIKRGAFVRTAVRMAFALGLGLAASSAYWLTLLTELAWSKGDTIKPGVRFVYSQNFIFQDWTQSDLRVWWANLLGLSMLMMCWPALAALVSRRERQTRPGRTALTITLVFSFLMTTALSWPLWAVIPKLASLEYPWRWLAVVSVVGAVALAASLQFWGGLVKTRRRPLALLALGSLLITLAFVYAQPVRQAIYLDHSRFDTLLQTTQGSASLPEFLPVWANKPLEPLTGPVETMNRPVTIGTWTPERRTFQIAPGAMSAARVRAFFYPHWRATDEQGRALPLAPAEDGSLLIGLPTEAVSVTLEFQEPLSARVAGLVSALAWLLLGTLFVLSRREKPEREPLAP